jgi:hypothetical protein
MEGPMLLRKILTAFTIIVCLPAIGTASSAENLEAASTAGKVVFMLVLEPGVAGVDEAKQIAADAATKCEDGIVIEMDRTDPANSELVKMYGLSTAPMPIIMVFASNGILGGGLPAKNATPDNLINLIPSPKKAEALKALQSGLPVLLTFTRDGMTAKSDVLGGCAKACGRMSNKCQFIEVNMDDQAETSLMNQLKVNRESSDPVTIVFNAQGQMTATFDGSFDVGKLVKAATQKAAGCCPPGSGKTCPPAKKDKGKK